MDGVCVCVCVCVCVLGSAGGVRHVYGVEGGGVIQVFLSPPLGVVRMDCHHSHCNSWSQQGWC